MSGAPPGGCAYIGAGIGGGSGGAAAGAGAPRCISGDVAVGAGAAYWSGDDCAEGTGTGCAGALLYGEAPIDAGGGGMTGAMGGAERGA